MAPLWPAFLALFLAARPALSADIKAVEIAAPLNSAAPQKLSAPTDLVLPASALTSQLDGVAPQPLKETVLHQLSAGHAAATPQAYAQVPETRGVYVGQAKPYFAVALEKMGVSMGLVGKLENYIAAPGRHPGAQTEVFHGLHHTYDVAAVVARMLEHPSAKTLTREQKALILLSALFHDIDPTRKPGDAASVARTLDLLTSDPETAQVLDDVKAELGVTPAQMKAFIKATDYSPNKEVREANAAETQRLLKEQFGDAEWAQTWSKHVGNGDKLSSYLADPAYADRQVRGLANEFSMEALDLAKTSGAFIKPLRDTPSFALLPAELQANFDSVIKHFDAVAADPSRFARDFPARGPPAPTAQEAFELEADAAKVPDATLAKLAAGMRGPGFAILSKEGLMDPAVEAAVLAALKNRTQRASFVLFDRLGTIPRKSRPHFDGWLQNGLGLRGVVARLSRALRITLPGERLKLYNVSLRFENRETDDQYIHVDDNYITATYSFDSPGTDVWDDSAGIVKYLKAAKGEFTVITGRGRHEQGFAKGTVHARPRWTGPRIVLVVEYLRSDVEQADNDGGAMNKRVESVMSRYSRQTATVRRAAAQVKKKGWFSGWFDE
jgi:hypothetical protein